MGKANQIIKQNSFTEFLLYTSPNGKVKVEIFLKNENIWLTQVKIADLFGVQRPAITKHLKNIFESGELNEEVVSSILEHTSKHGALVEKTQTQPVKIYNLDAIISVGYRVNSSRATQFRIWATERLKEYIIKGFTMDDERLKELGGGTYWYELLNRIRDIRSSEKVLYRQVLDIYATSVDYDPKSKESIQFFKIIQNKLHFAAHGHTAAEVIANRANAGKPFMGLLSFSESGVIKKDIAIAKNYLNESELKVLNNLVSAFFDLAEVKAMDHQPMHMKDWIAQLDKLITVFDKKLLSKSGNVSHKQALQRAEIEYQKYQAKTISPVEEVYLQSIKTMEKIVNKKIEKAKNLKS